MDDQQLEETLRPREVREIFVQLARLNGKFDTVKQDFAVQRVDIEKLTLRLDTLEGKLAEDAIRNAVEDERRRITRFFIDAFLMLLAAAVGALEIGTLFK
jgi:hypothetical protein